MNKEWTSLSSKVATVTHTHTHTQCLPRCVNTRTHTHTYLCHSHTCQSCFSLTERRKGERETQHFAGLELLASVGLVWLSIHVQRQRLSDLLFGGWWAWVLRTEGFWHCVHLWVYSYALTGLMRVYVCIACFVCDVAEPWAFWGSSTLLCDREAEAQSQTALRFYSEVEKRATKAASPWESLWLNCLHYMPRKPATPISLYGFKKKKKLN